MKGRNLADMLAGLWKDSGYLEHLPCPFAVRGSNDGGVDIEEASGLEKEVRRKGQVVSNSGHSPNQIGSRPQMGDIS